VNDSEAKTQKTYKAKDEAAKLLKELKKIKDPLEGRRALAEMRASGSLTPKIEEELIKLLKREAEIRSQQERAGIILNR